MLRIVVFDTGWGGELVADYLAREIKVVEIVRVIDWRQGGYGACTQSEICRLVEESLTSYIGTVDLIILGGYVVSLAMDYLRELYPEQRFVGVGVNYDLILRARKYPEEIAILASPLRDGIILQEELQENLPYSTLIVPDCASWEQLIDDDLMTEEILREELGCDFVLQERRVTTAPIIPAKKLAESAHKIAVKNDPKCSMLLAAIEKFESAANAAAREEDSVLRRDTVAAQSGRLSPDAVLLLNTHFWGLKPELERLFGLNVRVIDFREKLLHDVCLALHLRGVHGKRAK